MIHDPHHTHGAVTFIHQNKKLFIINLQSSFSLALDCSYHLFLSFGLSKFLKIFNFNNVKFQDELSNWIFHWMSNDPSHSYMNMTTSSQYFFFLFCQNRLFFYGYSTNKCWWHQFIFIFFLSVSFSLIALLSFRYFGCFIVRQVFFSCHCLVHSSLSKIMVVWRFVAVVVVDFILLLRCL